MIISLLLALKYNKVEEQKNKEKLKWEDQRK